MKKFGQIIKDVEYDQRPGSYGVIIKNGRIGVVKSKPLDKYFLPGGGIEEGETEIEALHREAFEEIGREIEIIKKIGVATEYFYARIDKKYIAKICNFFRIIVKDLTETSARNKLFWIERGDLSKMYHRSHQWIVETELAKK